MEEDVKNDFFKAITVFLLITILFSITALFIIDKKLGEKMLWTEKSTCKEKNLELLNNQEEYLVCYNKYDKTTHRISRSGVVLT